MIDFLPQTSFKAASDSSLEPLEGDHGEIGLKGEGFEGGLNVNNRFDKQYYDGMGTFPSGYYGEPRHAMVNAKWKF